MPGYSAHDCTRSALAPRIRGSNCVLCRDGGAASSSAN
jgi:hypothetical protein